MDAPIQYAKTSDGVNIAFSTLGEGTPFLMMPLLPWSHLQLEWQVPAARAVFERRAVRHLVVRYDPRGMGLSERGDRFEEPVRLYEVRWREEGMKSP